MECHGFDFSASMRRLCRDMATRLPALSHIAVDRVAISLCRTRQSGEYGMYAALTPLRFEGGRTQTKLNGRRYGVQPIHNAAGDEYRYILSS